MNCRVCGGRLRHAGSDESYTGAVHEHYVCRDCRAGGCLSVNRPGRRPVVRRGRALR